MIRTIRNRWSDVVMWSGEAATIKDAVHAAFAAGAVLTGADLTGADLTAVLTGAVLTGAVLTGAVLTGAVLRGIRDDFWAVLSAAPDEVPALIAALREGRVDGSTYHGVCACLVGTIANARHCAYTELPILKPDASRPAERFFLAIRQGSTPETNQCAALAVEWAEDWLARMRGAFGGVQ